MGGRTRANTIILRSLRLSGSGWSAGGIARTVKILALLEFLCFLSDSAEAVLYGPMGGFAAEEV